MEPIPAKTEQEERETHTDNIKTLLVQYREALIQTEITRTQYEVI